MASFLKKNRVFHRWLGIVLALPLLILAVTGALLTRPDVFPVREKITAYVVSPKDVRFHVKADGMGLWRSFDGGKTFEPWEFPGGVSEPAAALAFTPEGTRLFVAFAEAGVFEAQELLYWEAVPLPFSPVVDRSLLEDVRAASADHLVLRTCNAVWEGKREKKEWHWTLREKFAREDLYRVLHAWHTGWVFGPLGMRVVEGFGWLLVFLTLSGVYLFWKSIGARKQK